MVTTAFPVAEVVTAGTSEAPDRVAVKVPPAASASDGTAKMAARSVSTASDRFMRLHLFGARNARRLLASLTTSPRDRIARRLGSPSKASRVPWGQRTDRARLRGVASS